jgi:hypothetical protein
MWDAPNSTMDMLGQLNYLEDHASQVRWVISKVVLTNYQVSWSRWLIISKHEELEWNDWPTMFWTGVHDGSCLELGPSEGRGVHWPNPEPNDYICGLGSNARMLKFASVSSPKIYSWISFVFTVKWCPFEIKQKKAWNVLGWSMKTKARGKWPLF